MLSFSFVLLTIARESAVRINEILDEEPTISNPIKPIYEVPKGSIEFENVSFSYIDDLSTRLSLENINLKIEKVNL